MTTFKQIEANRRNALKSRGPTSAEGKRRSRCNAVRHGLTAETVIGALEDAEDYKAFEAAIIADYDAQSAVERELVLRLASLLWRVRRASTMETGLFEIQARHVLDFRNTRAQGPSERLSNAGVLSGAAHSATKMQAPAAEQNADHRSTELAECFSRLASLPTLPLDRLSRYEATLWRQAGRTIITLEALHRRKPWERRSGSRPRHREQWRVGLEDNN